MSKSVDNLPNENPKHLRSNPANADVRDIPADDEAAPLISLIDKPMDDMTPDELREHVQQLRAAAGSNGTLQAQMADKSAKKRSGKPKSSSSRSAPKTAELLNKYSF